jgi:photosystem II stability/assembly factor-like uncharacterized protein
LVSNRVLRHSLMAVVSVSTGVVLQLGAGRIAHAATQIVRFGSSEANMPSGGAASAVGFGKIWIGLTYTADSGRSWVKRIPPPLATSMFRGEPAEIQHTYFVSETRGWLTGLHHIWATSDGGQTWSIRFDGRPFGFAFSVGGSGWTASGNKDEIRNYVTADRGATWHECGEAWYMPTYAPYVSAYFIDSKRGWTVIARYNDLELSIEQGVAKTEDGGCTWKPIWWRPSGNPDSLSNITFIDANTGWLASTNRSPLFATIDGGLTWTQVPLPTPRFTSYSAYLINRGEGFVYGDAENQSAFESGIYFTMDGGLTWSGVSVNDLIKNHNLAKRIPTSWTDAAVRRMNLIRKQSKTAGK